MVSEKRMGAKKKPEVDGSLNCVCRCHKSSRSQNKDFWPFSRAHNCEILVSAGVFRRASEISHISSPWTSSHIIALYSVGGGGGRVKSGSAIAWHIRRLTRHQESCL